MGLLSFVSGLSSFATLHSWITEQLDNLGDHRKEAQINHISLEFKETYLMKLNDEFTEEKLDRYIAENASEFSTSSIFELFSSEERERVIQDFFHKNPGLQYTDKEKIVSILNEYLDRLSDYINQNLTYDTKLILKTLKDGDRSTNAHLKAISEKLSGHNDYANAELSNAIISKCNAINALMLKHVQVNLWLTDVESDFITGTSLKDIVIKLKALFDLINKKELDRISGADSDNAIEALFQMVKALAPDLSTELNTYYNQQIIPVIASINGYMEKKETYYMAIGALGLFNDNSDASIYDCVMKHLLSFISLSFSVLDQLWKDRDYEKIDREVGDDMHRYLLRHIEYLMDEDSMKLIQTIYDKKTILDIELAELFSLDVDHLRKKLYKCTEKFLAYRYYDNVSTLLFIDRVYVTTFERYYAKIFAEAQDEG